MVPLSSLWLPILISAVLVFIVSSLIHMVLTYHRTDYRKLSSEDEFMETLRRLGVAPGDYFIPYAGTPAVMKTPEFKEKMRRGPLATMTVRRSYAMGKQLVQWFLYSVVVGIFAGYVAGRALPAGAEYLSVFRFAGTVAFVGYSLALWQISIWYGRSWATTLKLTFDGLVYALLTAGTFGWLWPR